MQKLYQLPTLENLRQNMLTSHTSLSRKEVNFVWKLELTLTLPSKFLITEIKLNLGNDICYN